MSTSRRRFLRSLLTGLVVAPLAARRVLGAPVKAPLQMVDGWWTNNPAWLYYDMAVSRPRQGIMVWVDYTQPDASHAPTVVVHDDLDQGYATPFRSVHVGSYACTSAAQAERVGRWILAQERMRS